MRSFWISIAHDDDYPLLLRRHAWSTFTKAPAQDLEYNRHRARMLGLSDYATLDASHFPGILDQAMPEGLRGTAAVADR